MKLAIISDLHSNKEALDAVFAHVRAQGIQTMICLGDVVGYGPDPQHCVDLVRGHAEITVMGNHDEALFHDAADFNPHAKSAIDWTRSQLRPRWWSGSETKGRWRWLRDLPHSHTIDRFTFVHGSTRDPVREYVLSTDGFLNPSKLRAIFDSFDGSLSAATTTGAHSEDMRFVGLEGPMSSRSTCRRVRRGSSTSDPSASRGTANRACYAVLSEDSVTWHRVPYDYRATMDKILATGALSEILARRPGAREVIRCLPPTTPVVLVTFPSDEVAAEVCRALVGERHAACANLVPGIRSLYSWEGALQDDAEVLALVKTTSSAASALEARILELHPYDTPRSSRSSRRTSRRATSPGCGPASDRPGRRTPRELDGRRRRRSDGSGGERAQRPASEAGRSLRSHALHRAPLARSRSTPASGRRHDGVDRGPLAHGRDSRGGGVAPPRGPVPAPRGHVRRRWRRSICATS